MADDTELADRPAHSDKEIEITPEMIEAGANVIRFEYETTPEFMLSSMVYQAMERARTRLDRSPGSFASPVIRGLSNNGTRDESEPKRGRPLTR